MNHQESNLQQSCVNKFRYTSQGNIMGYYRGYYYFIYDRPHGKYCCRIGKKGEWLWSEGYFGTSLQTMNKAVRWAYNKINTNEKAY